VDDPLERFAGLYDRYYRNVLRYAAAWRAAGSPAAWHGGEQRPRYDVTTSGTGGAPRPGELNATTTPSAPSGTWIASDGVVGFIEGDLPG
jgi:hypothetical protein